MAIHWGRTAVACLLATSGLMVVGPAIAKPRHAVPAADVRSDADARADALVARMTRDEKLTLVFGYFGSIWPNYQVPAAAREGSAGYVPGIPRLGIPPQWETDAGIGVATQGGSLHKRERTALPSGLATAATWDPAIAHAGGAMIGAEARASGFNVMLAGGIDLAREPRNGRNFEYAGEDPLLAGAIVGAEIAGIQSNHIISTIKHYAMNDQETGRNNGNAVIDDASARMSDLLAFEIAIERGRPGSVMCSYNLVNGVHACENPYLLSDVLRRDWHYPGYVMSDWGATHSTVAAANAGLDQDSGYPFDKEPYFGKPLAAAVADGQVSPARLDQMAHRIVRSMIVNGVIAHPVVPGPIDFAAHRAVSRADAEAGIVLLKNEGDLLPLAASARRIAVIGGHADKGVLAGSGSSLVYPVGGNAVPGIAPTGWPGPVMYYPSSPLAALRQELPRADIRFADGADPAAAAALAKDSSIAIVFVTQWATESQDTSIDLGAQNALVDAVAAANPHTVVVMETGGPVLTPFADHVPALIEAWYPGTDGGRAIADILTGRTNPSGHLPVTFPAAMSDLVRPGPIDPTGQREGASGDVVYSEGAAVGYKYYDKHGLKPAFAFGRGLSYTHFTHGGLRVVSRGAGLTVSFVAHNVGRRRGSDVAQVYVAPVAGGWEAPRRLGGFAKLALAPGQRATGRVVVDPRLLATYDPVTHGWRIAAGRYRVTLGTASDAIVAETTVTLSARSLPADWHPR